MKKTGWIVSLLFALLLAGCGQNTAADEEKDNKGTETAETEAESKETSETDKKATSQEVLAAASEKSAELKNFAMDGTLNMVMKSGEETMETNADMQTKTNVDPLVMQQTMQMEAEGQTNTIDMYMDEEFIYIKDLQSGGWVKMKQAGPGMGEMMNQQKTMTPADQIKQLEQMADDIQMEETESEYILNVKGNGEKLMSLTGSMMGSDPAMQAALEQMDIEQIDYTYTLDKETYFPKSLNMDIKMFITENDQKIEMQQTITSQFSEMNELENFSIPEEVLNEAVEVDPAA
ncbi:hypothetical protein M4D55_06580 [Metabacillus idriensis]|uniref:LppX_LprAFG lipoprotein n=1 Tax=Metabacillus idriensis TaxID=324768 RepID=A0A6I2M373_9BACI|nr:DUF6612 family protein [Metabacillus idriensis]MCM3595457.1 hypothetical protein [Metabacillus idriensis]MRX52518.1 hypothetical protein [Metabacillus idriensis]OHR68760.1 hypothetical protein HMPREF3291_08490 [Bacillus sp. HMSC76G11]